MVILSKRVILNVEALLTETQDPQHVMKETATTLLRTTDPEMEETAAKDPDLGNPREAMGQDLTHKKEKIIETPTLIRILKFTSPALEEKPEKTT